MILSAALGLDHAAFLRDQSEPIGPEAAILVLDMARRRMRHEPISRILGHREFFGLDFAVDFSALDPRPDTETLVESVIDAAAERWRAPLTLLDLGTGSGPFSPLSCEFSVRLRCRRRSVGKCLPDR